MRNQQGLRKDLFSAFLDYIATIRPSVERAALGMDDEFPGKLENEESANCIVQLRTCAPKLYCKTVLFHAEKIDEKL